MKGNDSGRGTGLALVLILVVALVAAWLVLTQLRTIQPPRDNSAAQQATDLVQQARDGVDALNERMRQAAGD